MTEIVATTDGGLRVDASDGHNTCVMDEPLEIEGGTDVAMTPMKTLVASLAGCTAMTLKLYSARKAWPLVDVRVTITYTPPPRTEKGAPHRFAQAVELIGDLDEEQRERLLQIAGRCPVHKVLEGPCEFSEHLAEAAGTE